MNHWYCIYTKPKYEGLLCERLSGLSDIETFNPKLKVHNFIRGRFREVVEELFPCYIFSRFDPLRYYHTIKYTRGVRHIVGDASGAPYIIDEGIIDLIRSNIKEGYVSLDQTDFKTGDQVVIRCGPLNGLKGVFLRKMKASERVLVLLNTIDYQARIEVDRSILVRHNEI
jgi:transcriptional antiterminator RfaH